MRRTLYSLISLALVAALMLGGCTRPRVTVPEVRGLSIDEARVEIESKNLVPYPIAGTEAPEVNLEGIVYLQDPAASRRVPKESGVRLTYYTTIPPPLVEPRVWAIIGTALPGCEYMWADIGAPHYDKLSAYGNRYYWPNYDLMEELGMKFFVNIRAEDWRFSQEKQEELSRLRNYVKNTLAQAKITGATEALAAPQFEISLSRYKELLAQAVPNDDEITRAVNAWKGRPGCGGFWSDTLGHEPDICNQDPEARIRFKNKVRECDPHGEQDRPVMEMMNCTSYHDFPDHPYNGWEYGYVPEAFDLVFMDNYGWADNDADMSAEIERLFRKLVLPFNKEKQLIPQINAYQYRPGSIWCAYNTWKRLLALPEYDNPYRGKKFGMAFYCDEAIRRNPEMQNEIKEVIAEMMQ